MLLDWSCMTKHVSLVQLLHSTTWECNMCMQQLESLICIWHLALHSLVTLFILDEHFWRSLSMFACMTINIPTTHVPRVIGMIHTIDWI